MTHRIHESHAVKRGQTADRSVNAPLPPRSGKPADLFVWLPDRMAALHDEQGETAPGRRRSVSQAPSFVEFSSMTSHPDTQPPEPEKDRHEETADSAEQQSSSALESDAEVTFAGPHAVDPPGAEATLIQQRLDLSAEDISRILTDVAEKLVPEQQDLERTLSETSLKPFSGDARQDPSGLTPPLQSGSLRPRRLQLNRELAANAPGVDLSQDYVTLNKLGEGGMGIVHLARQVALGRNVALKLIHQRSRRRQTVRDEFLAEAVLTGKLEHPNIVPVYEAGESEGGDLFYAMKNIKGQAWNDTIDELTLSENLGILIDVCDAIAFAHAEGVIHRDLKPQNIMTGSFGEVLVLDWGLAVLTSAGEDVTASTGGTPGYMAPEMVRPPFLVGPRSDVYLLGAVLFRCLSGRAPHTARSARSSLEAALKNEIIVPDRQRLREQDPTGELLSVAMKAMATDPADRHQTVIEFQQAIREFQAHQESLMLASRAEESLETAGQRGDYNRYSEAVFGFRQAVELWAGNVAAEEGINRSLHAYAMCAEQKEDYELGLSLLDESNPAHQDVIRRLVAARDERNARRGRLRRMKQGLFTAAVMMLAVVSCAAFWINQARIAADEQRSIAVAEKNKAEQARQAEVKQRKLADRKTAEAQRSAYSSDMLLAQRDWDDANIGHLKGLLNRYRANEGLKGFEWGYWDRLINSDLLTLKGHRFDVNGAAFSPDGQHLASASSDGTVKVWDVATGRETLTLNGHTGSVMSVAFSPNGQRIASASGDHTVKVWDVATGQETLTLKGHADAVVDVDFSFDGQRLASASDDETVKTWDVVTGQELLTLDGHTAEVNSVTFSPNGQQLASASDDGTVKVWEVATGQELLALNGHTLGVNSVAFSPDGKRLASAGGDWTVKVWDVGTGQERLVLNGHTAMVFSAVFSPNGKWLATASWDNTVKLWDALRGRELLTLKGHHNEVNDVVFSPDGQQLASAGNDWTVKVWQTAAKLESLVLKAPPSDFQNVAFSPDGQRLASANQDGTVRLWDAVSGQETLTLNGHTGSVTSVAFSPNGQRIASASQDQTVKLWDAATGQVMRTLEGHAGSVQDVVFSVDGQRLTSTGGDETVRVWDAGTGQELLEFNEDVTTVDGMAFSPDGQQLAWANQDGLVRLWATATGQEALTLKGHTDGVLDVIFSPDGKQLASASWDRTVKLWDAATGQEMHTLKGHTRHVLGVAFSPDGQRLASAGHDSGVKLWDTATGQELLTLKVHTDRGVAVTSIVFSPDGQRLAIVSMDETLNYDSIVKIWDARPWTPKLRAQTQARFLLTAKREQMKSLEDLQAGIRSDRTISDLVRQQALDWCELFWKNRQAGTQ